MGRREKSKTYLSVDVRGGSSGSTDGDEDVRKGAGGINLLYLLKFVSFLCF